MRALELYDYAVIRVVPRVEREEFINAGVILSCQASGFLAAATAGQDERQDDYDGEDEGEETGFTERTHEQSPFCIDLKRIHA